MSNSKVVNDLLSQLQTQIKNYKNKLANKPPESNTSNVSNMVDSGDFLIEDGYTYDAPAESEFVVDYSNKETEEDQGSIKEYVLKCACHNVKNEELVDGNNSVIEGEQMDNNTSIVIDGEPQKDPIIGNTSIIENPKVDTVIGNTSEIESQPKLTEKEKSFFG